MMSLSAKSFGVNTAATPSAEPHGVRLGDDAADHHRHVAGAGLAQPPSTSGTSSMCDPERIDRPTRCTSSATAAADDLLGREPDALVDDLEPGVARPHGDLLGAVAVPVQPRACRRAAAAARRAPRRCGATVARTSARASAPAPATPTEPLTPVGARNSPNTSRSAPAHSPVVTPARAHSRVAAMRLVSEPASATRRASADAARSLRSGSASRSSRHRRTAADGGGLDAGIHPLDGGVEVGGERVGLGRPEPVDARRRRARRTRSGGAAASATRPARPSCSRTRRRPPRRPCCCTRSISARAPRRARRPWPSTTVEPSKMSSYSSRSLSKAAPAGCAATTAGPTAG